MRFLGLVLLRERNAFVYLLEGQFTLDGSERKVLVKSLKIGENPLCCVSGVVINTHLVLGDEDVFLQRVELSVVCEFVASVVSLC